MILYFVRHQAEGVVWRYPFLTPPTDAQKQAVFALCTASHGVAHPKTREAYWVQVVEVPALNEGEMPPEPSAPEPPGVSRIGLEEYELSGVGHVENPEG